MYLYNVRYILIIVKIIIGIVRCNNVNIARQKKLIRNLGIFTLFLYFDDFEAAANYIQINYDQICRRTLSIYICRVNASRRFSTYIATYTLKCIRNESRYMLQIPYSSTHFSLRHDEISLIAKVISHRVTKST